MLAFDLPDYSKSSTAQNEKLARERGREKQRREEGILQGPDIHAVSQLSRILPPSPRASRRFGVAVMSESEETQSGRLLIWRQRKKKKRMGDGEKRGKEREREIPFINDVSVYSTPVLDQPYM